MVSVRSPFLAFVHVALLGSLLVSPLASAGPTGDPCSPPGPVRDLTVTRTATGNLLEWTAPDSQGTAPLLGYRILRIDLGDPNMPAKSHHAGPGATSWTDADTNGPMPTLYPFSDGAFLYMVFSYNACGTGTGSNPAFMIGGIGLPATGNYPHCMFLGIIYRPVWPYVDGPHFECLLPLPL